PSSDLQDQPNDGCVGFIGLAKDRTIDQREAKIDIANLSPDDIGRFISGAVVFDERLADFFRTRANELDLALEKETEAIDRVDVERIADRDDEPTFAEGHGN